MRPNATSMSGDSIGHTWRATPWADSWRSNWPGVAALPDVAHVPMLDDPELVARTILAATGVAALQ